jgi:hypothetical protein
MKNHPSVSTETILIDARTDSDLKLVFCLTNPHSYFKCSVQFTEKLKFFQHLFSA